MRCLVKPASMMINQNRLGYRIPYVQLSETTTKRSRRKWGSLGSLSTFSEELRYFGGSARLHMIDFPLNGGDMACDQGFSRGLQEIQYSVSPHSPAHER